MSAATRLVVNVDGGSRGNPGPAAIAAVASDPAGEVLEERAERSAGRPTTSPSTARCCSGSSWRRSSGPSELELVGDSELIVRQVQGEYKVKDADLKPLHAQVAAPRRLRELVDPRRPPRAERACRPARQRSSGRGGAVIRPATLSAARASIVVAPAAIVLAIVIVIASRADRALASHVSCGDTITTDTKLDSNLVNCPDNGIVIGADGVTLDLNGHVIDGDGTLRTDCPKQVICDVGVVNDGHDRLTVKHGAVRQFGLGLLVGTARRNRILGLSGSRNLFSGIVLALAFRTVVRNSAFVRNGLHTDQSGIVLFDSHRNRILGNSFRRNGDIGMFVDRSTHNLIKGNLIVRNPEAGSTSSTEPRIRSGATGSSETATASWWTTALGM